MVCQTCAGTCYVQVVDNFIYKVSGKNYALNYAKWTIVTGCSQYPHDSSGTADCLENSNIFPGRMLGLAACLCCQTLTHVMI